MSDTFNLQPDFHNPAPPELEPEPENPTPEASDTTSKSHPPQEEVERYYQERPVKLPNGKFGCPMPSCDREEDSPNAIGPHKASHARHYGLVKPTGSKPGTFTGRRNQKPASGTKQRLDCPICSSSVARGHIKTHLMGPHRRTKEQANEIANPILNATRANGVPTGNNQHTKGKEVEPAQPKSPTEPRLDMSPDDVAMAVVMSQVNGNVPTDLLPEVIAYVDATRRLIAALKR